jgi:hypothetical protein
MFSFFDKWIFCSYWVQFYCISVVATAAGAEAKAEAQRSVINEFLIYREEMGYLETHMSHGLRQTR